jgi:hypothetical protein
VVNANGLIGLGNRYVSVGFELAGRRITLRLDGVVAHIIVDGMQARTIPAPVPPEPRASCAELGWPLPTSHPPLPRPGG